MPSSRRSSSRPPRRQLCRSLARYVLQLQQPVAKLDKLTDRNYHGLAQFCVAVHEEADFAVEDFVWAAVLCRRLRIAAHVNQVGVPPHLTPARQALIGLYLSQAQMWDEPLDHAVWCRFTGGHSFPTFVSWVFDFAAIIDHDVMMFRAAPDTVCAQHVLYALADSASVRDGVRREAQFVHSACRDAGRSVTPIADWLDDVGTSIKNIVVPTTGKAATVPHVLVESAASVGSSRRHRSTTTSSSVSSSKRGDASVHERGIRHHRHHHHHHRRAHQHQHHHRHESVTSTSRRLPHDDVAVVPDGSAKQERRAAQSVSSKISAQSCTTACSRSSLASKPMDIPGRPQRLFASVSSHGRSK